MNGQIIHDSIHSRAGWTQGICSSPAVIRSLRLGAVAGPWQGKPTLYEFYVLSIIDARVRVISHLLTASRAVMITFRPMTRS